MAKTPDEVYYTPAGSPVLPDKFDMRVRGRHLTKGVLTFEDVKKHVQSLPDDAEFAEVRSYDAVTKEDSDSSSDSENLTH